MTQASPLQDLQTQVPQPRHRIFMPQTLGERIKGAAWSVARALLFRTSPERFYRWRIWVLRLFGARIDWSAKISPSVHIDFPWNLRIDADAVICNDCILNCMGQVAIGERTRLSQHAHVCAGTHDYQRRDMMIVRCPITIGRNVWIAADAFVGPGVTVGDNCVLAARSSAFHDLAPGQVCVGEPARPRGPRFAGMSDLSATPSTVDAPR